MIKKKEIKNKNKKRKQEPRTIDASVLLNEIKNLKGRNKTNRDSLDGINSTLAELVDFTNYINETQKTYQTEDLDPRLFVIETKIDALVDLFLKIFEEINIKVEPSILVKLGLEEEEKEQTVKAMPKKTKGKSK